MRVMNALALDRKIVVNQAGEPVEVVIPYDQFVDFMETYGLDLTEEEKEALREANADIENENWDAFIDAEDLDKELACTE